MAALLPDDDLATPEEIVSAILLMVGLIETNKKRLLEVVDDALTLVNIDDPESLDDDTRRQLAKFGDRCRKRIEDKVYTKSTVAIKELADTFEQGCELLRGVLKKVEATRDGRSG
jgi:hypothetical protein